MRLRSNIGLAPVKSDRLKLGLQGIAQHLGCASRSGRSSIDFGDGAADAPGLRVDVNDQGKPMLVGVRPGKKEWVSVQEGMSDGTRDQLYLALRPASLETYLRKHDPVPFIVDDLLINFDDDRAAAALKALAQLSERTQVLFFTHHQHLVDLATNTLDDDVLFKHQLKGKSSLPSTAARRKGILPTAIPPAAI